MRKVFLLLTTLICAAWSDQGQVEGQCRDDGSGQSCGQEALRDGDAFIQAQVLAKKISGKVSQLQEDEHELGDRCTELEKKYSGCKKDDFVKKKDGCKPSKDEYMYYYAQCSETATGGYSSALQMMAAKNATEAPQQEDSGEADKEVILEEFRFNLSACMNDMTGDGVNDGRKEELDLIYQAEVLKKAHELGLVKEENIVWAAVLAAQTGAQRIAREQSRNALLETLAKHNMTNAIRDKFVSQLKSLTHLCNDSSEVVTVVNDETQLLSTDGGPLKASSAQAAMELAEYVISKCSADALNLEWFFSHAASISNNLFCGTLVDKEIKSTLGDQAVVHDAHIQTVLALHNEENQLGHDYAKHLKHVTDGIITHKEFAYSREEKLRDALRSDLSKPTLAKLRYLENKHFSKLHGATKRELCAQRKQLKEKQPDHFSLQSDTVYTKMYKCICEDDEIAVVCQARYHEDIVDEQPHAFKRTQQAVQEEKESRRHIASEKTSDTSSVARANTTWADPSGGGLCETPIEGCIMIGGDVTNVQASHAGFKCCLPPQADANIWGSTTCGFDIFTLFARLSSPKLTIEASLSMHYGWPAVECAFKIVISIGIQTAMSGHWTDVMVNFNIFITLDVCIGGTLGDIASALGWSACQRIGEIRYYPFIGKLAGALRLPVFNAYVVSAWARLDIAGPVHDVTDAIKNVIRNPDVSAFKAACPCCRGTNMRHYHDRAASLVAADESSGVNADNDDAYIEDEEDEKKVNEDEDAERDGAEDDEVEEEDKKMGEGDEVAEKDDGEALLQGEKNAANSGFWRRRRRRRRDRRRRDRRRRDRRRRERRRACVRYWAGASLASYDETSEDTANSEDAANLGFWRRRRRRRRDRRRYCLTRPCNGGSAREYWKRKMEDARGGLVLKITGEACFAWWCKDLVSFEWKWGTPPIHV